MSRRPLDRGSADASHRPNLAESAGDPHPGPAPAPNKVTSHPVGGEGKARPVAPVPGKAARPPPAVHAGGQRTPQQLQGARPDLHPRR